MPTITRWFVKTSFVFLGVGLALGVYLLLPGRPVGGLFPVYLHLLTVGWLTQLIFGIAIWMLPKFSLERPRGYEGLNWLVYISLNLGLGLRAIFEPLPMEALAPWRGVALVAAAGLQWLAGVVFAAQAWVRVKGR